MPLYEIRTDMNRTKTTTPTPRPLRCELVADANGFYLTVEATPDETLDNDVDAFLLADGWRFLNNGVSLENDRLAVGCLYFKPRK